MRCAPLRWPMCIIAIGLLCGIVSASMSWHHLPAPSLHDEFSNLLLADTLLHGRLANPAPQIWQPFQSFHVLVNPSYASKYPLGTGAILAGGWWLTGTPAAGIWFSAALCAAAVTWAAGACLPRRWALLSGLLLAISPTVHHQWSLCYMNGWLAAACGAVVAGSILRLKAARQDVTRRAASNNVSPTRRVGSLSPAPTLTTYLPLGIGISGLALTRPFEGLLFTLTSGALLLYWWRHSLIESIAAHTRALITWTAAPIALTMCLMGIHNQATTGSVTCMPYQLHETQYGVAPLNIFQSPKRPQMTEWSAEVPPTVLAFHYGWSLDSYLKRNHWLGWCSAVAERLHVVNKLWGILFCLPMALMIVVQRGPHRVLGVAVGLALLVGSFVPWYYSHYFAPSLVWLVILSTLSAVWFLKRLAPSRPAQQLAFSCLMGIQSIFMLGEVLGANNRIYTWADDRQQLVERFRELGGKHLVLVRYHAQHNVHDEWVYNGADLENGQVVWARSWRPDLDQQLLEHYADRHVWVLQLDEEDRPQLAPLTPRS